ncbi:MAG: response regulator [Verrucomicrobiia bacterium]
MTAILDKTPKQQTNKVAIHRILLVEDHPVVSSGLSALINFEVDLQVCGIAQDYASAIAMMTALNPDLIISDISLRGPNGLELLRDIKARCPKQRVLVLSMHDESVYGPRALGAGASGYVMKQEACETLLMAIHRVLDGEVYLSASMEKQMMRRLVQPQFVLDPAGCLTDRELKVLGLIGQAKTTREIAEELHLSVKTIGSHRDHIKQKLNLKGGRELLQHALRR